MTLVVAHRGASTKAPENTMDAYRLAIEQGADAIELDVHLTADGQLAVIHDETLERTTDGSGAVATLTMEQIRGFDAGATFAGGDESFPYRGQGLRVPTLPEVTEWLPAEVGLVIEIKARAAVDEVVSLLRQAEDVRRRASVISFDEHAVQRSRELDPELATGLLLVPFDSFERGLVWVTEQGHTAIHPWDGDLGMDPMPLISQATAFGCRVGCYVVNDPERMQQLAAAGLWGFVTDVPEVARQAIPR
jgi:glycerophosphoryl diester phosphodiesterase